MLRTQVGDAAGETTAAGGDFEAGAYMLGKMLWEKGYDRLFDLMHSGKERLGDSFPVDVYGSGAEAELIKAGAEERDLPVTFHPATDHATLSQYRVFVNPSISEVLCTTVAEALAMGKWVVCARHPSNEFFYQVSCSDALVSYTIALL
jgi:digalactosyldiacylglycerol synthase